MARQTGLTFTGRIDGLSFYHDRLNGYLVRRTGGVTSKQYRTDDRYAAARDASSEFSIVSRTGKLIREALQPFLQPIKDGTMVNRMNKELVALKQLDNLHSRGKRTPLTMLTDGEANRHFRIFQFNEAVKIYDLSTHFPVVEQQQHVLTMQVGRFLLSAFPESATHAGLTIVRTVIDFERGSFETRSSRMVLVSSDNQHELSLAIPEIPSCGGIELICLQVVFFREQHGDLVQLAGKVHSMGIVAVGIPDLAVSKDVIRFTKPVRLRAGSYRKARILMRREVKGLVVKGNYRYSGCSPPLKT
ncbi:MAG: hypothetical protein V4604_06315 [Bacteroidota bacterium]